MSFACAIPQVFVRSGFTSSLQKSVKRLAGAVKEEGHDGDHKNCHHLSHKRDALCRPRENDHRVHHKVKLIAHIPYLFRKGKGEKDRRRGPFLLALEDQHETKERGKRQIQPVCAAPHAVRRAEHPKQKPQCSEKGKGGNKSRRAASTVPEKPPLRRQEPRCGPEKKRIASGRCPVVDRGRILPGTEGRRLEDNRDPGKDQKDRNDMVSALPALCCRREKERADQIELQLQSHVPKVGKERVIRHLRKVGRALLDLVHVVPAGEHGEGLSPHTPETDRRKNSCKKARDEDRQNQGRIDAGDPLPVIARNGKLSRLRLRKICHRDEIPGEYKEQVHTEEPARKNVGAKMVQQNTTGSNGPVTGSSRNFFLSHDNLLQGYRPPAGGIVSEGHAAVPKSVPNSWSGFPKSIQDVHSGQNGFVQDRGG